MGARTRRWLFLAAGRHAGPDGLGGSGVSRSSRCWIQAAEHESVSRGDLRPGAEFELLGAHLLADLPHREEDLQPGNRVSVGLDLGLAPDCDSLSSGMDLGPEPLRASFDGARLRHTLSFRRAAASNASGTPWVLLGSIRNRLRLRPADESGDGPVASRLPGVARVATPQTRRGLGPPGWSFPVHLAARHPSLCRP